MSFTTVPYLAVLVVAVCAVDKTYFETVSNAAKSVSSHHATVENDVHKVFHNHPVFHSHTTNTASKTPSCPNPNDPSAVFELASSPELEANYPIPLIASELSVRPNLAAVLVSEIPAQSGLDLVIPADEPFDKAEMKCAETATNIFTFKSAQGRGVCWILQGFQDAVFAVNCVNPICKGCDASKTLNHQPSFPAFDENFWKSFYLPSFPSFNTGFHHLTPTYKNICAPKFDVRTIWAYCPLSADALKIVREQIIVPTACSCKKVACK